MSKRRGTARMIAVARGDEPADLLLTGGKVFVPGTREWIETDLAIGDGVVVGWGSRDAIEVVDVEGALLTPGFVDPHMHLESTKLWIDEFVRSVLPHGTTAVAADPHEVANVFGVPGVLALARVAEDLPFTFGICASSCVPASPFESPGAELDHVDIAELLENPGVIGIAEVMNFPGVIAGDVEVLAKIAEAGPRRVDGHAPGVSGRALDAYLTAGIESDHECTELEEAEEKRRKGMWIFVREGSASRNLAALIPTVLRHGTERVALCTDDREPDTLVHDGHINDCVRLAVKAGVPVEDALVLATANPAEYHHFDHLGWLAPGYQADVLCFEDFSNFEPSQVWQAGRLVALGGEVVPGVVPTTTAPEWMLHSVHLDNPPGAKAYALAPAVSGRAHVIGVSSRSLSSRDLVLDVNDPTQDVARIAVVERHRRTGRVGLGYVSGFGLRRGAMASTVAHDAHNCMAVGARDDSGPVDMAVGVARLAEIGGGQVAVLDGRVIAEVPLPIGGLMSTASARDVAQQVGALTDAVSRHLGVTIEAPFMQLSFLGLSVIPELRITDRGLVDVTRFALTDLTEV
ncbi:MAG TPA: adenine deaminase [Acidimicrobiales bacterium]|nr:adenine deaminase [Acidimicrobiales bacterium]